MVDGERLDYLGKRLLFVHGFIHLWPEYSMSVRLLT
jgi:hypothetical protein